VTVDMGALGRADEADKVAIVVPDQVAGDRVITYGELEERTNRLAHALVALGVELLDRVAVMLPNGAEFLEAGLGAAKAAAELVPINRHLKRDEVAWILADSGAKILVADATFIDVVAGALDAAPGCRAVLVGSGDERDYERLLAEAEPERPSRDGFAAPEYFFYTSGTTGRPRGVERDPPAVGRPPAVLPVAMMWGLTGDDVYLVASPLYHATCAYAFTHLYLGATVVCPPRWDASEWLRLVEQHSVTVGFVTPAHLIRILEVPEDEREARDLSSLRLLLHAAAPCPVAVKHKALAAFPDSTEIWEFYGASEGGATRISPQEWLEHPGSVGKPWPGTEVLIVGDDGAALPPGGTGVIYIRPPAQLSRFRYHHDEEKTDRAWRDDAFTVGDMGHVDDDGYLYITDRVSDMILRGGVNVYPAEIEQCLYTHPAVVDCAVLGVPDERSGEAILALVEARTAVTVEDLGNHCRAHLADFKCPQHFELVDELPRDPNGKVLKRQLREQISG
jgi:long-chain acyl-CoA synthetase